MSNDHDKSPTQGRKETTINSWDLETFDQKDSVRKARKPMNVFELEEYLKEQERLLNPTLSDASTLEEEPEPPKLTQEEIDAIKQTAYDEAYQAGLIAGQQAGYTTGLEEGQKKGYEEGYLSGSTTVQTEIKRLNDLITNIETVFTDYETDIAPKLTELILHISQQVIRDTVYHNPQVINTVLSECFGYMLGNETSKQLLLNPEDYELLFNKHQAEFNAQHWQLSPDQSIERGGCLIKTQQNEIDAQISTRWERTIQALGQNMEWQKLKREE